MSHRFYKLWLKISAVLLGIFGPVFLLATVPATEELARWSLDVLSWPIDGAQNFEAPTSRFIAALSGGFLLGWGVLIWNLSGAIYDAAPEAVRRAVLFSLCAWFVLDSTGSVLSGNTSNAFFNVLVLLILVGPLWRPVAGGAHKSASD